MMLQRASLALALAAAFAVPALAETCAASATPLSYPLAKKVDQVDDYFGTKVADPYRWLEDANSAETKSWVDAENAVTQSFLSTIPARDKIKARLTQLWNYERFSAPYKEGGRYFFSRNDGLQNQSVLYTVKNLNDTPKVVLDPNTLASDGTVALSGTAVSPDGKLLAYGTAASGSDWNEWHVRDIDSGKDLPDVLKWVKFSGASWTKDGKGFFYSRYDAPSEANKLASVNEFQKLYYHRLGTDQSQDALIYDRPDQKEWGFGGQVTDDGRYLVITVTQSTARKYRIFVKDLQAKNAKVVPLIDNFDAGYDFIDNIGTVFYFNTDRKAPRSRVVAIDLKHPEEANWKEVVAEQKESLQGANILNNQLVLTYLQDAHSVVHVHDLKGKLLRDVKLPGIGTAGGFGGKRHDSETFYAFSGYTTPTTVYRYDLKTGDSSIFRQPKVDFDPSQYETRQVFYTSKDGTKVPMFITSKKGIKLDGSNPTYLYGYGGFNISLTPGFSAALLTWMELGGVYAVPNLRGGGEYGEAWHEAGTKLKKQNVFDDFIGAAQWLVDNKITSPAKLAIGGGSNGGLLVGAAMTQRPELFGAALPAVGVMDMLRFHKFTIGWAWKADYGSSENADEFKALYAYSPLHNLKPACYPATMITTADHDDRVVPAHSFKFAATAQAAQLSPNPMLIRIETKAGHGAGKPTTKIIEETADKWGFLTKALNMTM